MAGPGRSRALERWLNNADNIDLSTVQLLFRKGLNAMKRFLPTFFCTVIVLGSALHILKERAFTSAFFTEAATTHVPVNQASTIRIENFRAVNVANGRLNVTVDYTYPGEVVGKVIIRITPREKDGVVRPRAVGSDLIPVQSGTHTVTIAGIKNSTGPVLTSVDVRVCISKDGTALFCRDFPYEKTWTNGPDQFCSITGQLTGSLTGLSSPDHAGPSSTVTLRQMYAESPDGERQRATITNRSYVFTNLYANVEYTIYPDRFDSQPMRETVLCRSDSQHRVDFRILRPAGGG
jgi:hypothetical protein